MLRQQGIWYSQALGLPNHRAISILCRNADQVEDGFRAFGIETPEDHADFRAERLTALRADVSAARRAGAHTYVISNEHCHSRLKYQPMVDRAAEFLRPLFDEIEVVCFLRPQVDLALSLTSTTSRCGLYVSRRIFGAAVPGNGYYNYAALLERWATAFGRNAITPVSFRRNPAPVEWFKTHLGISETAELVPVRRVNATLDYRTVAMMNAIVGEENRGFVSTVPPMYRRVQAEDLPCETPLSFSRADAQATQAKFADQNEALVSAWPQLQAADLMPDLGRYPEVGTLDQIDKADIGPMVQLVVGRLNADLALARAQVHLWESRDEERKGDTATALERMEMAVAQLDMATQVTTLADWATEQKGHYLVRVARLQEILASPAPAPKRRRLLPRFRPLRLARRLVRAVRWEPVRPTPALRQRSRTEA